MSSLVTVLLLLQSLLLPVLGSALNRHTVRRLVGGREREVRHLTLSARNISHVARHSFSGGAPYNGLQAEISNN